MRVFCYIMICYIMIGGLAVASVSPAYAGNIPTPTKHEKSSYGLYYLGMEIGKIRLWWEEDATHYKVTASIKTSGIARIFTKQKRHVELYGEKRGQDYIPLTYDASVEYSHKQRKTNITYDNGRMSSIISEPTQDNPLDAQQQARAIDPLSALLQLNNYARTRTTHPLFFATETFDGKRLNRLYAVPDEVSEKCSGTCERYRMYRKPLAGYNAKKMARYLEGEPPVLLSIYPTLSRFPHALEVKTRLGTLKAVRVKEEN